MSTRHERQRAYLKRGEVCCQDKNFNKALELFKRAILTCKCNESTILSARSLGVAIADIPLPACHCKDYFSLPADNKQAISNLAEAPCSCGSGIKPCQDQAHFEALSHISGVHERKKDHQTALQCAKMLASVAPHRPEGYLKMAKLLRLANPEISIKSSTLCNLLYIQASRKAPTNGDQGLKWGKALRSVIRRDIVASLPRELSVMVLSYLTQGDLSCRAMRVSQTWKTICLDPALWRHLRFVKRLRSSKIRQTLRLGVLNEVVVNRSAQLATTVTIDGLWDFGIGAAQLRAMLRALCNLKTLTVTGSRGKCWSGREAPVILSKFSDYWRTVCCDAPSTLTTVSLAGFDHDCYRDYYANSISNRIFETFQHDWLVGIGLAKSLESLSLAFVTCADLELVAVGTLCRNDFSKLETLSLVNPSSISAILHPVLEAPDHTLAVAQLARCAPALKDLILNLEFQGYDAHNKPDFITHLDPGCDENLPPMVPWKELRRLSMDSKTRGWDFVYYKTTVPLSDSLRVLELRDDGFMHACYMSEYQESRYCTSIPRGLEHILCHFDWDDTIQNDIFPNVLSEGNPFRCFKPSIDSGCLRSLDIVYVPTMRTLLDEIFMHQKGALNTLSCSGIDIQQLVYNWEECVSWMATFPNLKIAGLYPFEPNQYHEKGWLMVTRFMELRPDVRTIYTTVLRGAVRDEVLARATSRGVTIIEEGRVPEPALQFPPPPPWEGPVIEVEEGIESTEATEEVSAVTN